MATPWRHPPLTPAEEDTLFMLLMEDDTEDAPWMVMGDLQFWSASGFAHSLRTYGHEHELAWYVAAMLPIVYDWPGVANRKQLSPDCFVAFVPEHPRTSYDLAVEREFPSFVLEVISPSSSRRDRQDKRRAYAMLGAREYALFTPRSGKPSALEGYRLDAHGRFVRWLPDEQGRLWSEVLGLYLVVAGALLHAQTAEGQVLLSPEEEALARRRAEMEQRRAETERQRAEERQRSAEEQHRFAEAEAAQLRRELARYQQQYGDNRER